MKCTNKVLLAAMLTTSPIVIAGNWYDDWDKETITIYETTKVYGGFADCEANGEYLYAYIPESTFSSVTLYSTTFGTGWVYPGQLTPYGVNKCSASIGYVGTITDAVDTHTSYSPRLPYPSNVDIERLGCVGSQRKVLVNISGITSAVNNVKIYATASPSYPETLYYSGTAAVSTKLITVNASTSNVNFRIKLDNGSSYYTSAKYMSCTSGNIRPLD